MVSWKEAGGQEAVHVERRPGDAQQDRSGGRGLSAFGQDLGVPLLVDCCRSTVSPGSKLGVSRIVDLHLAQHLGDDQLDVLVVNRHALGAIDLLHLVDEVALDGVPALDSENLLAGSWEPSVRPVPAVTSSPVLTVMSRRGRYVLVLPLVLIGPGDGDEVVRRSRRCPPTRAMTSLLASATVSASTSESSSGSASISPRFTIEPSSTIGTKPSGRTYSSVYSSTLVTQDAARVRLFRSPRQRRRFRTVPLRPSVCGPRRAPRTRGRPLVMSSPATPPVWNVRIVS